MKKSKEKGFIVKIVLLIIAIIALEMYFKFDLIEWLQSPTVQKVLSAVWNFIKSIYNWIINFF